jgi:hypothetical protein
MDAVAYFLHAKSAGAVVFEMAVLSLKGKACL